MTINWSLFVPGVFLLLFPADRLLSSGVEMRSFESFQSLEDNPRHRPWWWVPALGLDPIRALAGTLLIKWALGVEVTRWAVAPPPPYWLMIAILGLGVLSQIYTRRESQVLLAPIGFVAGMVAALTPWPVAVIGVVMAVMGVFAFRQFHAFFSVGLGTVAFLGFVLDAHVAWIGPAVGALGLPIAAGLVTGCTLELPTRSAEGPRPRRHVSD